MNQPADRPADLPTVIDGFEVPDNADDVRGWYADAADQVAQLDGDNLNSKASRVAHRRLAAARQAMEAFGLPHGGPRRDPHPAGPAFLGDGSPNPSRG